MKAQAQKALDELQALGAPVIERGDDYNAHFLISGERNMEGNDTIWADYYQEFRTSELDDFGVNKAITAILNKHGLFAEWYNPGFLCVYSA